MCKKSIKLLKNKSKKRTNKWQKRLKKGQKSDRSGLKNDSKRVKIMVKIGVENGTKMRLKMRSEHLNILHSNEKLKRISKNKHKLKSNQLH